jgi:hypothetical protein
MSIELIKVAGKSLIFDGNEDDFYKTYSLTLENGDFITIPILINTRLKDLNTDRPELTSSITKSLTNIKLNDFGNDLWNYQNENGLTIFVYETEKYLTIVSKGEVNRGRFQIVIEGIFHSPAKTVLRFNLLE